MEEITELTFKELQIEGYERVVEVVDNSCGLHAIIAIHDSTLGTALGGIRVHDYNSFDEALTDVLRLSEGMTRKAAISRTGTGGGKAVIFGKSRAPKSDEMLLAFAEAVNYLDGQYICAEDVGMSDKDVAVIHRKTEYVVGLPETSGNPSPFTAWGVFRGVQASCMKLFGVPSAKGRTIAIQGLGVVGMLLARHLFWDGAQLIVSDINERAVQAAVKEFGAKAVSPDEILSVECDILAPCALGGILTEGAISQLRCKGVAGAANNQLLKVENGDALYKRSILYAPDFVINAGGLINVSVEVMPEGYSAVMARQKVDHIYDVLLEIFELSDEHQKPTNRVADEITAHNLEQGIGKRTEKIVFHSKIS